MADMELAKRFAYCLKGRRTALDMKQKDLAEACGLGPTRISQLEGGRIEPLASTLIALAMALDTTTDHLLGLDGAEADVATDSETE